MIWTGNELMETETSFAFVDQPCPKAFPCRGRTTEHRLSWTAVKGRSPQREWVTISSKVSPSPRGAEELIPAVILHRHLSLRRPKKIAIAPLALAVISFAPRGVRAGWAPIFLRLPIENIGTSCAMRYDLPPAMRAGTTPHVAWRWL